jgi:alpha-mannosidase
MLFGFGDGGGGPTKRMIETLRRCRNLLGVPRTQTRTSADFFARLEKDCTDRPLMIGELYFEYHRGTYTTQASTKRNNRKNEFLLHDLEFLAACAHKLAQAPYPRAELEQAWRLLLTNQFHDILPGSSITLVYQDTEKQHAEVRKLCEPLRAAAARALAPQESRGGEWTPVNTTGFARREVAELPNGRLVFVDAPSYGVGAVVPAPDLVSVKKRGQEIVLENQHIKAVLSTGGDLLSLVEKESGRESLTGPANVLELYDDRPTNYDAWDVDPYHVETRQPCPPAHACEVHAGPLRASVVFEREIGRKSGVTQTVRLDAGARRLEFHTDADWHEDCKMLKVAFPVNARAMNATYEMQFGCVERPTHYNTSYDLARYEVPGHKWADLSEPGFGVALLTDCKYGYSSFGDTLRISLLRSPKSPDPVADMGKHSFAYAVLPHAGGWREGGVVSEAIRFNVPVVLVPGHARPQALLSVDQPNLVLDTVKLAEDSDAVVLRFYEAHGARGVARAMCALPFKKAVFCNILEEDGAAVAVRNGRLEIPYTPFQVVSVKLV